MKPLPATLSLLSFVLALLSVGLVSGGMVLPAIVISWCGTLALLFVFLAFPAGKSLGQDG